ncbi:hypothetical protein ACVW07_001470 [Cellulomonas sp. URHB0016]
MNYGNRIMNHADPKDVEPIAPPRNALVTTELCDGTTPTLPVWAVAKSSHYICVRQRVGSELDWFAWVCRWSRHSSVAARWTWPSVNTRPRSAVTDGPRSRNAR